MMRAVLAHLPLAFGPVTVHAVGCAAPCDAQGAPDGIVGRLIVIGLGVLLVILILSALWSLFRGRSGR